LKKESLSEDDLVEMFGYVKIKTRLKREVYMK